MTTTLKLWFSTIKTTFTNVGALLIFAIIYTILLATFFRFIWIREATVWQVLFTYVFMILIPAEFFIFQAAIIDRVRDQRFRWRAIVIDAIKFFVATIPILLIGWLLYYLLNKIAVRYPAPAIPVLPVTQGPPRAQPLHWPSLLFATFRFVLLGVALPLAAIHVWISIAGGEVSSLFIGGAKSFLTRTSSALARAFASESVLIYALGLIIFFVLPYIILVPTFTVKGNKTEFTIFVLRLLLAYLVSLFGWVVTVSALTTSSTETAPAMAVAIAQPVEAVA